MKRTCSILEILKSICENKYDRSEINQLIELTQRFAFSYIKYRYQNINRFLMAEDFTLEELSIDAIAPLFERDNTGLFIKIIKAFNCWEPLIETEEQATFFINRLVSKSTEKYVSELLRDSDPFFSKILDSINYLIEKDNYHKKILIGITYIVEKEDFIKIGSLPDNNFIKELPFELFVDNKKIISKIFDFIKSKTVLTPAIPLNALVMKIKQVRISDFIFKESEYSINESELDSIVSKALEVTFNKMQDSYLIKGKLSEIEVFKIKKAIENIMYDLRDGGINSGLHNYFLEQFTELNINDYKYNYQNIFEYLYKVLKKEVVKQLK